MRMITPLVLLWTIAGALMAFFVSMGADQVLHPTGSTALLFEDGAKFLGVLGWRLYFVLTTRDIVRSTITAVTSLQPGTVATVRAEQDATLESMLNR
jgi:hypothetical protein